MKTIGVLTSGGDAPGRNAAICASAYGFNVGADLARVAAQVVTGIGFLGAGTILHQRGSVHGLTTAASLWVTAAIGLAVGVGMVFVSVETAVLVFLLLHFGPRPGLSTLSRGGE